MTLPAPAARRRLLQAALRRERRSDGADPARDVATGAPATAVPFTPSLRYPDPAVQVLDPSFLRYRLYSSTLERLATGLRWAEGPAYFPERGELLVSDIPNNRLLRYRERDGSVTVFRRGANYANGNVRDRQGRLVSCEHSMTRRIVRTEHDGRLTVLAERFEGRRFNAPNDIVVRSDDSLWFSDPLFGISGHWEGVPAVPEQPTTNVYRLGPDGRLDAVITDLVNPNGLAFSPDERHLYVVESGARPHRRIWRWDVLENSRAVNKTLFVEARDHGAPDGFAVDRDGNLWCGWGSDGALQPEPVAQGGRLVYAPLGCSENLDGVMVFNPQGRAIGFIRLPERCANVTFGGASNNRLYMAASHSLYALHVNAQGAV